MRQNTPVAAAVSAADTAAVAEFENPGTDHRLRLRYVVASYNAAPTGGLLTIAGLDGGETWEIDMPAAGPVVLPGLDLQSAPGTNIVITLAAAGANVSGKVNAYATFE